MIEMLMKGVSTNLFKHCYYKSLIQGVYPNCFFFSKIVSIFCWAAIGRKNVAPAKSIGCTLFNFVYNFAELLQQ